MIRKETDSDNSGIKDMNSESLHNDNIVNGKTILSREHILRTCKSEVKIAMLPIVLVMLAICVLST